MPVLSWATEAGLVDLGVPVKAKDDGCSIEIAKYHIINGLVSDNMW